MSLVVFISVFISLFLHTVFESGWILVGASIFKMICKTVIEGFFFSSLDFDEVKTLLHCSWLCVFTRWALTLLLFQYLCSLHFRLRINDWVLFCVHSLLLHPTLPSVLLLEWGREVLCETNYTLIEHVILSSSNYDEERKCLRRVKDVNEYGDEDDAHVHTVNHVISSCSETMKKCMYTFPFFLSMNEHMMMNSSCCSGYSVIST